MTAGTIGIITNDPHAVFQRAVISGMQEVAERSDYKIAVHVSQVTPQELAKLAGVLVIANSLPDQTLREIYQQGKPISLIAHRLPDMPIPMVLSNNQQGIAELVHHLVTRCHRQQIVFIRGLMDQIDGQERELAFRQEAIRHNLRIPPEHFLQGDFSPTVAAQALENLLHRGLSFDSIIAADYLMGIAAVEVLRKAGIAVPEQVSVVGFGDDPEAETAGLTTVAASITELGACAARQLISQIKGMRISGATMLSVRLMVRETCGYQPKAATLENR